MHRSTLAMLLVLMLGATARASTVAPMTLDEMADHAGQVIVGDVVAVHSRWRDGRSRIESAVTFEHVEHLKGAEPGAGRRFTLVAPGGTIGRTTMRLCCAPTFEVGRRYVLFVLPEYRTHPVVGLHRGAFSVREDSRGVARIYQEDVLPVTGIAADGTIAVAGIRRHEPLPTPRGEGAVRLADRPRPDPSARAVTFDEFVTLIRPSLDRSRDHALTRPAGVRVEADLRATSLEPARDRAASRPTTEAER